MKMGHRVCLYMDVLNGTSPLDYLVKSGNSLLISLEV